MNVVVDQNLEGFWTVAVGTLDGHRQTWCSVLRRRPHSGYVIEYRFDVVSDDGRVVEAFRGVSTWRSIELPYDRRGHALWHARAMALDIADMYAAEVREILMDRSRDPRAFLAEVARQPWVRDFEAVRLQD